MSQNLSSSRLVVALNDVLEITENLRLIANHDMENGLDAIREKVNQALKPEPLIQDIDPTRKERDPLDYRHIDEFLDDTMIQFSHPELKYVNFFLSHARKSASERLMHDPFMAQFQLFADYEGKTYQITGASRLGDIWLTEDFRKDAQYSHRVEPDFRKFSNWRDKADWKLSHDERMVLAYASGFEITRLVGKRTPTTYTLNWMSSNGIPEWYSETTPEQRKALYDHMLADAKRRAS
ncbi:hypothetical protein [Xanthomonas phage RTH11]|nr:hypothetical protein [Xanthomonas phage RTH11]